MLCLFAFFVFVAFGQNNLIECRPAADRSTLASWKEKYDGDNETREAFRIVSSGVGSDETTTKFAMLLKQKLAEEEKGEGSERTGVPRRRRRSRSLFFRLCVLYHRGRCLRRKRFGLWHKFQRDGSQS